MATTVGDDAFIEKKIQELLRVYRNAQSRLQRQLNSAGLTDFKRFRIEDELRQVREIVRALDAHARKISKSGLSNAYKVGVDLAGESLRRQGVDMTGINFGNRLHTGAINAVVDQMTLDLIGANESIQQTTGRILRAMRQALVDERQVNEIIARGLIEGETLRETAGRLSTALRNKLGDAQFVQAGSRSFTPEDYAKLVVLTRSREAQTAGVINAALEHDVRLFQVSVHEGACPVCQRYQGKVYSIDGSDDRFPRLDRKPPYHPRCGHVLLPFVIEAFTDEEIDAYSRMSKERDLSLDGEVAYQSALQGGRNVINHNRTGAVGGGQGSRRRPSGTPRSPQSTRPLGTPVSASISAANRRIEDIVERTLRAVDSVHGDGQLPSIQVKDFSDQFGPEGYFLALSARNTPVHIGVNIFPDRIDREFTIIHEIGHFLDQFGIGNGDPFNLPSIGANGPTVLDAWRQAVYQSSAYAELTRLRRTPYLRGFTSNGDAVNLPIDWDRVDYLMGEHELFARSYAQYIAIKSGDRDLVKQLQRAMLDVRVYNISAWYPRQWDEIDFLPIEAAFDELFEQLGWRS